MSRFSELKNGIYGRSYKGYYIETQPGRKKTYTVKDKDLNPLSQEFGTYEEAEWFIDKIAADETDLKIIHKMFQIDINELTAMVVNFARVDKKSLSDDEKTLYEWSRKVRYRREKGLEE